MNEEFWIAYGLGVVSGLCLAGIIVAIGFTRGTQRRSE